MPSKEQCAKLWDMLVKLTGEESAWAVESELIHPPERHEFWLGQAKEQDTNYDTRH